VVEALVLDFIDQTDHETTLYELIAIYKEFEQICRAALEKIMISGACEYCELKLTRYLFSSMSVSRLWRN
jgi:hypothetical protein